MSFTRKFGDKYGKKFMNTATKPGIDDAKTASKQVVQKTAGATGDLIRNKISDKIPPVGRTKSKEKRKQKTRILHTTRKKDSKLLMT